MQTMENGDLILEVEQVTHPRANESTEVHSFTYETGLTATSHCWRLNCVLPELRWKSLGSAHHRGTGRETRVVVDIGGLGQVLLEGGRSQASRTGALIQRWGAKTGAHCQHRDWTVQL